MLIIQYFGGAHVTVRVHPMFLHPLHGFLGIPLISTVSAPAITIFSLRFSASLAVAPHCESHPAPKRPCILIVLCRLTSPPTGTGPRHYAAFRGAAGLVRSIGIVLQLWGSSTFTDSTTVRGGRTTTATLNDRCILAGHPMPS